MTNEPKLWKNPWNLQFIWRALIKDKMLPIRTVSTIIYWQKIKICAGFLFFILGKFRIQFNIAHKWILFTVEARTSWCIKRFYIDDIFALSLWNLTMEIEKTISQGFEAVQHSNNDISSLLSTFLFKSTEKLHWKPYEFMRSCIESLIWFFSIGCCNRWLTFVTNKNARQTIVM